MPFTTDIPTYQIITLGNWTGLGGQRGQVVEVILLFSWSRSAQVSGQSWCLSGWDGHSCQSCVLLTIGRLVNGQYILDGKVVWKVRLVGAVYLLDWLDGHLTFVPTLSTRFCQDTKLNLFQDSEARFGEDFKFKFS